MRISAATLVVFSILATALGISEGQPAAAQNHLPLQEPAANSATTVTPIFDLSWHDADKRIAFHEPNNLFEQGQAYSRIVLFIESGNAPKTQLLRKSELPAWFARNGIRQETITVGNNLRANDLARFFNTAILQNETLTTAETLLLDALLEIGVLHQRHHGYRANVPEHILITVPKVSTVSGCIDCTITQGIRDAIMQHELAHARFFIDPIYRDFSIWYWAHGMSETIRDAFTKLLGSRGYDTNNRELLANEMQAFLMHTSNRMLFNAKMLAIDEGEIELAQKAFISGLSIFGLGDL